MIISGVGIIVRYKVSITEEERIKIESEVETPESMAIVMIETDFNEFQLEWEGVILFAKILKWTPEQIAQLKKDMINAQVTDLHRSGDV